MDLDETELCQMDSEYNGFVMAMADWEKTNSPLAYWTSKLKRDGASLTLDKRILEGKPVDFIYSLSREEAFEVCRQRFKYDIARLSVQIAEPDVMEIKKDKRVNFSDQLGAIGNRINSALKTFTTLLLGGTLGLFTGMSMISMVEAIFWLYKVLLGSFNIRTLVYFTLAGHMQSLWISNTSTHCGLIGCGQICMLI